MKHKIFFALLVLFATIFNNLAAQETAIEKPVENSSKFDSERELKKLDAELRLHWPKNRTLRFVFHGHSVPAGYFKTPIIRRFDSYPLLFQRKLCDAFPTALIDVSVTAIGGEESSSGADRFEADVLSLKPDVVFIDYSLNDRRIGLEKAKDAWRQMIHDCIEEKIIVVLLTPTPDSNEKILDASSPLAKHARQVRELGKEFGIPVADSYAEFGKLVAAGNKVEKYLSQANHPNREGHNVVAEVLASLFSKAE